MMEHLKQRMKDFVVNETQYEQQHPIMYGFTSKLCVVT